VASPGWPDYQVYIEQCWGYPLFDGGSWNALGAASNVVVGTNPPYSITDFYAFFPKYAGSILTVSGTLTGSATITNINTTGLATGQYIATLGPSPAIPPGTTIAQILVENASTGQILLSQSAGASGIFPLTVYVGPPLVPIQVINAYIALASDSLVQARWLDTWAIGIAYFVAHFATLYLRSEGNCSTPCGQAATAGLTSGIIISASAGGVSKGMKAVPGIDDWGAFGQTSYGATLIQWAKAIGAGCLWVY